MWVSTKICASHALTGRQCSDFGGLYESAVCEVVVMSEELVGAMELRVVRLHWKRFAASRGLMSWRILRRALFLHRAQPGVAVLLLPSAANGRVKAINFQWIGKFKDSSLILAIGPCQDAVWRTRTAHSQKWLCHDFALRSSGLIKASPA